MVPHFKRGKPGQKNIKDRADQDRDLRHGGYPCHQSQSQQGPSSKMSRYHIMRGYYIENAEAAGLVQKAHKLVPMFHDIEAFDKESDSEINPNSIDKNIRMRV